MYETNEVRAGYQWDCRGGTGVWIGPAKYGSFNEKKKGTLGNGKLAAFLLFP